MSGQWVLAYPGTEYAFGTSATPTFNRTTPEISGADTRSADTDRPRGDGRSFGADFRSGQTLNFDLGIRASSEEDVRAEAERLAQAWRADAVRLTPGAVAELRTEYAGRERVVYGRPRRYAPNFSDVSVNRFATVIADFACVDDVFYSPAEHSRTVALVPPAFGGILAPLAAPLTSTASTDRSIGFDVGGELGVWPVIEVHGPITNAVVEIVGVLRIELRTTLAHDDVAVIDTRPWMRSALRNGSGNLSGSLRGTRLAKAAIPPGRYEIVLRGIDATGTSYMTIRWQEAFASL